jgi:dsRNA-specific ribonuclease
VYFGILSNDQSKFLLYVFNLISALGSNQRLCNCANVTGIVNFILLAPLSRAEWKPCGLRYLKQAEIEDDDNLRLTTPSDKVCADVIESLIGIIFLRHGINVSMSVACELGISFNYGDADDTITWSDLSVDSTLIDFAASFLGVEKFQSPQLLVEATTHQSCLHKPVPSYQRLEWIGDAVLCLAIREWLFRFDANLTVPRLVVLETTLECNESLAFLGFKEGLCKFIDHRDSRLPNRFETFQRDLEKMERGLWCTGENGCL